MDYMYSGMGTYGGETSWFRTCTKYAKNDGTIRHQLHLLLRLLLLLLLLRLLLGGLWLYSPGLDGAMCVPMKHDGKIRTSGMMMAPQW